MQYRAFGRTGFKISALGFGAMRLPMTTVNGKSTVDEDLAIPLIRRGFERGINYIDTAYMYCAHQSEVTVGKALKGWRDQVRLSSKLPIGNVKSRGDFRRILEEQLRKLDVDCVDFYHFHGLCRERWEAEVQTWNLVGEMVRARDERLIRHLSFSFHDKPEVMRQFVDAGVFSSVLCQYNLIDRANEESMAYAHEKGLGVVVMGPVGGGRLGSPMEYVEQALGGKARTPEIALRFVLANPAVDCALSGMSTLQQLEENVEAASRLGPLSGDELHRVEEVMQSRKKLADLYCTGCGYCMPCPHEVNIPICFECMINEKVYGFTETAVKRYRAIGDQWLKGKRADACTQCGACEAKCPQKIPIRQQLKEVVSAFAPHVAGLKS
jgi:hypothetical protein